MKKAKVSLTFESEDQKIVSTIFRAINPDNVGIPKGISFNFNIIKGKVVLVVSSEKDLETLISTVREVLDNIGLCIQTIMVKDNDKN